MNKKKKTGTIGTINNNDNVGIKNILNIGDTISPKFGYELCGYFGLDYLMNRMRKFGPDNFLDFKFDGMSMLPDTLVAFIGCLDKDKLIYECALPHDLAYAYTEFGVHNDIERQRADLKLKSNLILKAEMSSWLAEIFYRAVRIGGAENLAANFSWGFATVNKI